MTTTYKGFAEVAELMAAGSGDKVYSVQVTETRRGYAAIECRVRPERQMDPTAKLPFVRLVQEDEGYWNLYHLTHNEVTLGEASFSHSLVSALYGVVDGIFETM